MGRVLVVGTDAWAVEQAATTLAAHDIDVATCHPIGEPDFPCNALVAGRECPLVAGFDVVVNVRARPIDIATPGEIGVVCALRAGAALVGAGMSRRNPFAPWVTRTVHDDTDLVAVVRAVLSELETVNLTEPADDPALLDLS